MDCILNDWENSPADRGKTWGLTPGPLRSWKRFRLDTPAQRSGKGSKHIERCVYDKSNVCPETLTRPRLASAGLFYSLHPAALLLPRIVRSIHVMDILGASTMKLDNGLFASPGEVIGQGLDDCDAAGG